MQGEGVFNAPDLEVGLEVSLAGCPERVTLRARVSNLGSLGVLPGIPVSFYEGPPGAGGLLRHRGCGADRALGGGGPTGGAGPPLCPFVFSRGVNFENKYKIIYKYDI